jgi:hypothetical protein
VPRLCGNKAPALVCKTEWFDRGSLAFHLLTTFVPDHYFSNSPLPQDACKAQEGGRGHSGNLLITSSLEAPDHSRQFCDGTSVSCAWCCPAADMNGNAAAAAASTYVHACVKTSASSLLLAGSNGPHACAVHSFLISCTAVHMCQCQPDSMFAEGTDGEVIQQYKPLTRSVTSL